MAGRVADIHHLLPASNLYIVGEHFLRVHHQLLTVPGAPAAGLADGAQPYPCARPMPQGHPRTEARSRLSPPTRPARRANSPRRKDKARAAIATRLAAEIYGLDVLKENIEDEEHNTTRFIVLSAEPHDAEPEDAPVITSFVFRVRNVPAALYKAMGGFATNGVNMTKLESYQLEGQFAATQFYADIEGHPSERNVRLALEELEFFTSHLRVLGVYKASPYRAEIARRMASFSG